MEKIFLFIIESFTLENLTGGFFGGVLGGLLSVYVAHRLALRRERRKEYNEIVDEYRPILRKNRSTVRADVPRLTDDQIERLRTVQWKKDCRCFDAAAERYRNAYKNIVLQSGSYGNFVFSDPEETVAAIDELLAFAERRE